MFTEGYFCLDAEDVFKLAPSYAAEQMCMVQSGSDRYPIVGHQLRRPLLKRGKANGARYPRRYPGPVLLKTYLS